MLVFSNASQMLVSASDLISIHFKRNFVCDSDKCHFSGMTKTEG